jgi:release factor glutamine methyltransferase
MLIKEAYRQLQFEIQAIYDHREAAVIADWIIEDITKWTKSQRILHHDVEFTTAQESLFTSMKKELLSGKPVQYVLGYSWFKGKKFIVNEHVLIPRPETEELVQAIIEQQSKEKNNDQFKVLDIGTGSGCIAISLQLHFPHWEVWAIDKSKSALDVVKENAFQLNASINTKEVDILSSLNIDDLPAFHLIVSNPPYIPLTDKQEMTTQVIDHEPHLALFVTNEDPLQFYKSILAFSEHHLMRGGTLWFETHMSYAKEVAALMKEHDYQDVYLKKDFQGKDRIVAGKRGGASL